MTNPHLRRHHLTGAAALGVSRVGQGSTAPTITIAPRSVTVGLVPCSWGTRAGRKDAADAGDPEAAPARG